MVNTPSRYNPAIIEDGSKHRFQLDSKKVKFHTLDHFLHGENRFSILERKDPETATRLHRDLEMLIEERYNRYKASVILWARLWCSASLVA